MSATPAAAAALSTQAFDVAMLGVGQRLLMRVQAGASEARLQSALLGWERSRALFARMPLDGMVPAAVAEGERIEARLFNGRQAMVFEATIERIHRAPFGYVVLSYPEWALVAPMRAPERVTVDLPARLAGVEPPVEAARVRLRDLCTRGTLLAMEGPPPGRVGDRVRLELDPEWASSPSGSVSLEATIRQLRAPHDDAAPSRWTVGVVFDAPDAVSMRAIEAAIAVARQRA